jgi:hypothetical protein
MHENWFARNSNSLVENGLYTLYLMIYSLGQLECTIVFIIEYIEVLIADLFIFWCFYQQLFCIQFQVEANSDWAQMNTTLKFYNFE